MKTKPYILIILMLLAAGCVTQFVPEVEESKELMVVEGLITDQPGPYVIKITRSFPLGEKGLAKPVSGCKIWVSDNNGNIFNFNPVNSGMSFDGTYKSLPSFMAVKGRKYTLHIQAPDRYTYESFPMELRAVPKLDSIYYEKRTIDQGIFSDAEGAQVFLSTHDPVNACRYYRWDFTETWQILIPFERPVNKVCWITEQSTGILIKSTTALAEDVIIHFPVNYITNQTDRLKNRYSILINQYSLNEEEYLYWEKLRSVSQNVGGLYDVVPAAIPNNLYCVENPSQKVLGYFSVSARSSMRKFISQGFKGIINPYADCISDTIHTLSPPAGLGQYVWVLESQQGPCSICPYQVLTNLRGCADCTVRGTNVKPDFWP